MKTALVILNYNNARDTRQCLESIVACNTAPVKIIVVDNASRPDEVEALRHAMDQVFDGKYDYLEAGGSAPVILAPVSLLQTGANLGYGKGNNAAIRLAYADPEIDRVMILNNDVLFIEDIIPSLIALQDSTDDCAIISPALLKKETDEYDLNCARLNQSVPSLIADNLLHYWRMFIGADPVKIRRRRFLLYGKRPSHVQAREGQTMPIELPSGSCMLIRKDLFHDIGDFDPETFMYFEENILYKKIDALGLRNYLSLSDRCIHFGASTTSVVTNKWLVRQAKNSEKYYVRAYSGASLPMRWLHAASVGIYMSLYSLQKKLKP